MKKLLVMAVAALVFTAAPVMAKEGFYIGAYFVPSVDISAVPVESGSGYGFRAGLGFNRYFGIEGSYEATEHDLTGGGSADLKGVAVDVKINFPLTSLDSNNVMTLEPYLRAGYGVDYELSWDSGSSSGSGLRLGLGLELYLFKELSISGGWTRTRVSFDDPIDKDSSIRAFDVGLNYHFI